MVNSARLQKAGERDSTLVRFLPARLAGRLSGEIDTPVAAWFEGACVFADIVGFTELTERFANSGEQGLEELAQVLTAGFSLCVDAVRRSGGEVVDFAGDALMAVWEARGGDRDWAVRAAASCATRMASELARSALGPVPLELHTGVGGGRLWAARVGGVESGLHLVLGGPAVREAVVAERLSERGEVLAGPTAVAAFGSDRVRAFRGGHAIIEPAPDAASALRPDEPPPELPLAAWPLGMIPRVVQERWTGQRDAWLSELRRVTALFVRVEGFDETTPDGLHSLQRAVDALARVASAFSLERGRLHLDDRGLVFVLVFGIPYNTHADDEPRAMRAALAISRRLSAEGFAVTSGLASGPAYCGVLGGENRSGYAIIGPAMNRAARLMEAAGSGLLCQASLAEMLEQPGVVLSDVGALRLKGVGELAAMRVAQTALAEASGELAGRTEEQAQIESMLEELADGHGAVLTLIGEAGLGKTTLARDLADRAHRRGLRATWARAEPDATVSYGPFRQIFAALLDLSPRLARAELEPLLARRLERLRRPEAVELLCSLLGGAEDEPASAARGAWRADATLELLTEIVRELAPAPSVLIFEDAHWIDSASYRLLERVAKLLPGLLVVLTSRSPDVIGIRRVQQAARRSHEVALRPLDEAASVELAQRLLGGRKPDERLLELVRRHSQGNPLYVVESLLLAGTPPSGARDGVDDARDSGVRLSMRALITSRLDRLSQADALVVRVASVLGVTFSWAHVQKLAAGGGSDGEATSERGLVRERIFVPVEGDDGMFRFSHAVLRDVAYELMLVQKRRALHLEAARLLESTRPRAPAATLAHHYEMAGEAEGTLTWSDRAGSEALELGAFEEATRHFERCLALAPSARGARLVEMLRFRRKLGDAYTGLGDLDARAEHARAGLALAGEKPREPRATTHVAAAGEFVLSALAPRTERAGGSGIEVAALYRHLAHVAYFESDGPGLFAHTLRALNAARADAPSAVLCGAMAELGGALGLGGLHRLGVRYLDRAVATAERLAHPHGLAYVHLVRSLYFVGRGAWLETRESADRCQEICERIGDPVNWGNAQIVRFWLAYYRGELALAETVSAALLSRARRTGNRQHETWALRGLGLLRLRQGALTTALPMLQTAVDNARDRDVNESMPTRAALALCHLRLGEAARAALLAESALSLARTLGRPTGHGILTGLTAVAEVAIATADSSPRSDERVAFALERLDAYRKVFPIGAAAYFHVRARCEERDRRPKRARHFRERSAAAAARLGMPNEGDAKPSGS